MYRLTRVIQRCSSAYEMINRGGTIKSKIGGSSKDPVYEKFRSFQNTALSKYEREGITIVKSKKQAEHVVSVLRKYSDRVHAWDTETTDVGVKTESKIGNGKIVCASVFCGPEVNFGNGPRLMIDNFAQNSDLIMIFKEYLEDQRYLKAWHNYGFDRQIFHNHGINVQGFGGDTLHLARLLDPSKKPQDYSLASLTAFHSEKMKEVKDGFVEHLKKQKLTTEEQEALHLFIECFINENPKENIAQVFGSKKEGGIVLTYPSVVQMHCKEEYIDKWVQYSTLDAEATYFLFYTMVNLLRESPVNLMHADRANEYGMRNLLDIYRVYWRPFGEILTDMEREGFLVDKAHVQQMKEQALLDMRQHEQQFSQWVQSTQTTSTQYFNPSSVQQLQQLFYGPWKSESTASKPLDHPYLIDADPHEEVEYNSDGRKVPSKREVMTSFPEEKEFVVPNPEYVPGDKSKPRNVTFTIKGIGITPTEFTEKRVPSVDVIALKKLAGKLQADGSYDGQIYQQFKEKNKDLDQATMACKAITSLLNLRAIEVLYGTFIEPLMNLETERVHCNLNLNTETGRLSSRNPNMQNQPALEKDRYKIRKSFVASPGKKLIVADYGQLELRVMAHMTNCKAMIDAFLLGGDFHSRTAMSMYPEIKKEIEEGKLLLEWDRSKGDAPAPLLKDKYANERKKAKTMNFSIAYGKTQQGFAADWGVSPNEAKKVIDLWYQERQEVRQWQNETKQKAMMYGYTQTLVGRMRMTEKYFSKLGAESSQQQTTIKSKSDVLDRYAYHGMRASINTPIQGGAADIVIAAMVKISKNQRLKNLGWKLLLQVHDELILEGPEESSKEALELVCHDMEHPFDFELRLPLEVDAKIGNNWYECK